MSVSEDFRGGIIIVGRDGVWVCSLSLTWADLTSTGYGTRYILSTNMTLFQIIRLISRTIYYI